MRDTLNALILSGVGHIHRSISICTVQVIHRSGVFTVTPTSTNTCNSVAIKNSVKIP